MTINLQLNRKLPAKIWAAMLLLLTVQYSFSQVSAPEPDWRRSDWATIRPNDNAPLNRQTAGEDWWYGHCNAYNGNEFVGRSNSFE